MTTKPNRILFDFDGTLIFHDKSTEGEQIANLLNIPKELQPKFYKRINDFFSSDKTKKYFARKRVTRELYREALADIIIPSDFGVTAEEVEEAINTKAKYYSILPDKVAETLEYLVNKGYKLAVITNGFYDIQCEIMKHKGIDKYFDQVFAWDNFFAKPHKRAFKRALAGTLPEENVMVGDDPLNDIKPAKELGMVTIGINLNQKTTETNKPDIQIKHIADLMKIL